MKIQHWQMIVVSLVLLGLHAGSWPIPRQRGPWDLKGSGTLGSVEVIRSESDPLS